MSGFLQRLALRDSGLAPSVVPRLPSWFEPASASAIGLPETDHASDAQPMPDVTTKPSPPQSPAQHAWPRVDPAPVDGAVRLASSLSIPAPRVEAPPLRPHPLAQGATPAPALRRPDGAATVASSAMAVPPSARPLLPAAPVSARPPAAVLQAPQHVAAADRPAPPAALPPHGAPAPVSTVALAPAAAPARRASPTAAARLGPAALLAARADGARRADPPPAAPDIVQISIGRIEVRAVQPAQAGAPLARPRQSPTSLDDYLARRNGEGKR